MSWFGDRVHGWVTFGKEGSAAVAELESNLQAGAQEQAGPSLILLVNDAAGIAAFQMHSFRDAEEARTFIEYWFPNCQEGGIIAFWGLTQEPASAATANGRRLEPVVLIRDERRSGVVYMFSFGEMEAARGFLRDEVAKGLLLDSVMLYLASTVSIETDARGRLRLNPETAPNLVELETAAVVQPVAIAPSTVEAVQQPALQQSETEIPEPATEADAPIPVVEPEVQTPEPAMVVEPAVAEEQEQVLAAVRAPVEASGKVEWPAEETPWIAPEVAETVSMTNWLDVGEKKVQPAKRAKNRNGAAKERRGPGPAAKRTEVPGVYQKLFGASSAEEPTPETRAEDSDVAETKFDIHTEVSKVLELKRWEEHNRPFEGFDSPPGRF